MKQTPYIIILFALLFSTSSSALQPEPLEWSSPCRDVRGSMPIGNGDIGVNAWVEPSGDLLLLLGKTDAWSECAGLFKLGRLRVTFDPPLSTDAGTFRQTLDMGTGTLRFRSESTDQLTELRLWVDANHPVIHVNVTASQNVNVSVDIESWRTQLRSLKNWPYYDGKSARAPARAYTDTIVTNPPAVALRDQLVWYYRNRDSIYKTTLAHQGLAAFKGDDPLTNRTFGCAVGGTGFVAEKPTTLVSGRPAKQQSFSVHALTAQTPSAEAWLKQLAAQTTTEDQRDAAACYTAHCDWWRAFWNRSWITISGGSPGEQREIKNINTGWCANRYLVACTARGEYPVKFNGSIFNVGHFDRVGTPRRGMTPDFRGWGTPYWFQNQRHIYWPMLAAGDFEQMRPFFRMYRDALPLALARSKIYCGHGGAFFPETMQFWGTYCNRNYGWNRKGKELGLTDNGYIRRYWQGGLELTAMMLSFYRHTGDQEFLNDTLLPVAAAVMTFYDEHYKRDASGRIHFYPAQVLESIWDAENPMPEIAGLHSNLPQLLALPHTVTTPVQRKQWQRILGELPPLPQGEIKGRKVLKDATIIRGGRHNAENAQLYAVWPYRLYGVGMPEHELALNTWMTRPVKFAAHSCWHNDILWGAFVGLPDQARHHLGSRFVNSGPFRFPAMYVNGDEVPDHDNGGVCQNTLQTMLMQTVGDKVLLLPTWPAHWNVSFKLHAPHKTIIEGIYSDGNLQTLKITPESRRKDVMPMFQASTQ